MAGVVLVAESRVRRRVGQFNPDGSWQFVDDPMPTVPHLALHLAKDAGALAAAAEKMEHPEEAGEGAALFDDWMGRRLANVERTLALLKAWHPASLPECEGPRQGPCYGVEPGEPCAFHAMTGADSA